MIDPTRALLALALLTLTACGPAPKRPDGPPPHPGPLLAADAWPAQVMLRQRVTAIWPQGTRGFDAALQRQGDELLLIGLAPFGPPGFVIRHGPGGVEVTNNTGEALPFDPRFMLADVQKAFYPWPADAAALGFEITRRVVDGRLAERVFSPADGAPPIRVEYGEAQIDGYPRAVELRNDRFGYRLRIETVEVQPLDGP